MLHFFLKIHRGMIRTFAKDCRNRFGIRPFLLVLSVIIGIFSALAAALLHTLVEKLEKVGMEIDSSTELWEGKLAWLSVIMFVPFAGIFLSYLVQHWLGGARYAKSLSPLILALNRRKVWIQFREVFTHLLSSAFSVGCGGSAGLEAPSVLTGAAIGSTSGSFFGVDKRHRILLIACGAASAISAIFNSPVGGVLFAVEVLLPEFSVGALVPMLMASGVAAVISRLIVPEASVSMLKVTADYQPVAIPFYILLGVLCAFIGIYIIRSCYFLGSFLRKKFVGAWSRLCAGGIMLCVILTIFPILRGQGYLFIAETFNGNTDKLISAAPLLRWIEPDTVTLVILLLAAVFLKTVASVLTVDSGGDGGVFAPTMFVGAFTGFAFARLVNLTGLVELNEANFLVAGMCGVFTTVMRAPLTGVFLIAEVCGGYILLVPLMIVSALSWMFSRPYEPNSIYRKVLIENKLLSDDPDLAMLKRLPVRLNLDDSAPHILPETSVMSAAFVLEECSSCRIFPVVDSNGVLQGTVSRHALNAALIDQAVSRELVVFDLIKKPYGTVSPDDDLALAMKKIEKRNVTFLPVVNSNGIFRGFVFKDVIFEQYRRLVRESETF